MDGSWFPQIKTRFLWWLTLAAVIRLVLMFFLSPITDAYYFTAEGVSCLLSLKNPYEHVFTAIPPELMTKGGQAVFAYLPFIPIFSLPFYLLGDIRFGFILCDIIIGYSIYKLNLENDYRRAMIASLVYLFFPATILWAVWTGVNTNVGIAFLMLSLLFLQKKDEVKAGLFFGLSLASIQFALVVAPFLVFFSFKNRMKKFLIYSLAVCGVIVAPFIISDVGGVINDILLFNLTRPTNPVFIMSSFPHAEFNLSINAFLYTFFGFTLPLTIKTMILLPALAWLLKDCIDFQRTITRVLIFSTLFFFVLLNNFLVNYLILTLSLSLITRNFKL